METLQPLSKANSRSGITAMAGLGPPLPLGQLCQSKVMNLAELSRSIRAHQHLRRLVVEEAQREPGWMGLSVEEAIVLLGQRRLYALVVNTAGEGAPDRSSMPRGSTGPSRGTAQGKLL